ncbi:hypothetical protein OM306_25205, partial [Escherichia albertii]|nr:hypothetical protein [Escherichia albertii]MCZ8950140.1 hypothetical protein [Escherichia albertii]MCZ8974111.1 hypothetical protein [Escherichia albertii]MCZ8984237.1 hypothetical protein [Escherichia albertii]MCZ9240904.1 hypothetical protein [Escherichia albertii]
IQLKGYLDIAYGICVIPSDPFSSRICAFFSSVDSGNFLNSTFIYFLTDCWETLPALIFL